MSTLITVSRKELQDHFNSWRFIALLCIVALALVYVYLAALNIRSAVTGSTEFVFLALFTSSSISAASSLLPSSFLTLMAILIPVFGIILGLDAINSERTDGTLSRLVSQPIYRDNIINAKFIAGIITIAVLMLVTILLASGIGIRIIGVAPSSEEVWRLFFFLIIGIIYGGFWLGLAILFSTLFKQVAVSAIVSIVVWLFFAFFYPIIFNLITGSLSGNSEEEFLKNAPTMITLQRISPIQLFEESMAVILVPATRSISQIIQLVTSDAANYLLPNALSLGQSLLSVWPQIITTFGLMIVCFAISYIKFMYEEIRAL